MTMSINQFYRVFQMLQFQMLQLKVITNNIAETDSCSDSRYSSKLF